LLLCSESQEIHQRAQKRFEQQEEEKKQDAQRAAEQVRAHANPISVRCSEYFSVVDLVFRPSLRLRCSRRRRSQPKRRSDRKHSGLQNRSGFRRHSLSVLRLISFSQSELEQALQQAHQFLSTSPRNGTGEAGPGTEGAAAGEVSAWHVPDSRQRPAMRCNSRHVLLLLLLMLCSPARRRSR
jgi:hypothetical protein